MLYRQKTGTFIRTFANIGYIINKDIYKEQIVNATGAVFLNALSRTSKSLEALSSEITDTFSGVDPLKIQKDALAFFTNLEDDGFIVSGESEVELDKKNTRFSYAALANPMDNLYTMNRSPKDTTEYLLENFRDNPHLFDMQIELTSRCNEHCIHCYIPYNNKSNIDIDDLLFYNILEQCHRLGVIDMTLSGGECMLHPRFADFLEKTAGYDFFVVILSNLTHLTDDILAILKKNQNFRVQVSLYSMNPAVHDEITQIPGSFRKTYNSILNLIENDIRIQINCPVMKQNKNDVRDIITWAQERRIHIEVDYNMMARTDQSTDNLVNRLTIGEVEQVLNDILHSDAEYRQRLSKDDLDINGEYEIRNNRFCGACITSLNIAENGNVCPCAAWQGFVLGNIKEQSLSDIWENSPNIKRIRNLCRKDIPQCIDCTNKSFCSVCLARNFNETPDRNMLKIPEYFCMEAALNRKIVMDWKKKRVQNYS
ncbi:PqqD family peptide modification chaperone [Treponema sp. R8-4-B8]